MTDKEIDELMSQRNYDLHLFEADGSYREYVSFFDPDTLENCTHMFKFVEVNNPIAINAAVNYGKSDATIELVYNAKRMLTALTTKFSLTHKDFRKFEQCIVFYAKLLHENDPFEEG